MDRRYEAFKRLLQPVKAESFHDADAAALTHVLAEGRDTEFWRHVKAEIDQHIRSSESRFLDTLAKSYEEYVAQWSRRQALIAIIAHVESSPRKEE